MGTKRQRRSFSAEFKARVVREVMTGQKTAAQVCREQQLKADLLSRWKADFVTHASSVSAGDERGQQTERHIAELPRLGGRVSLELHGAKKAALASGGDGTGP